MTTDTPRTASSAARSGFRWILLVLLALLVLAAGWLWAMMSWSYSSGERAGWVQKFSNKGWICKTWEGELALVTMPGTAQEKFPFTVRDEKVAQQLNAAMGKRVSLHYDEKVGLPGSCFGETRYWVSGFKVVEDIPLAPGIIVSTPVTPTPQASPAPETPAATSAVQK